MVEKNLELTLQSARLEYQNITYNTWTTQRSMLHTYLWLAVAIISAEGALLLRMMEKGQIIGATPNLLTLQSWAEIAAVLVLLAAILAGFWAFASGIDAMRGKQNAQSPVYGDYLYVMNVAETDRGGLRIRREMIQALEEAIAAHTKVADGRGKRLRKLSLVCTTSTILGAVAFACYCLPRVANMF